MLNLSEQARGGTFCTTKAGLAVGGTATHMRTNDPSGAGYTNYCIKGILYSVVDADDNIHFTAASQAASTTCLYLVCVDSSAAFTTVKGTEVTTADLTAGKVVLEWPVPTDGTCPIGAVKVVATSVFTAGTTALGTGNTATYYDLFAVPDTPITS
jgi:hypothetical protein